MELLPGGLLAERADEAEIPADPVADAAALSGIQREALELLEWGRLGEHVAGFASTTAGRRMCRELPLAPSLEASRQLLAQTTELLALDGVLEGGLSFQGVADLSRTVQLCAKGGVASADELLDVATTLAAARRLRRATARGRRGRAGRSRHADGLLPTQRAGGPCGSGAHLR